MDKQALKSHHVMVRWLHALLATAVVIQFALFYSSEWFPSLAPYKGTIYMLHKSLGNVGILVALLLILAGLRYGRPNHALPAIQHWTANIVKIGLLLSVIVMSMSGYVMTSAGGYGYRFFGLFDVPLLIGPNKELGKLAFTVHGWAGTTLLVLFIIHALAAMFHHFVKKDRVLRAMYFAD